MRKISISSGHGKYVRGAADILDEVDEARRVVSTVTEHLRKAGCEVVEIHDDTSTTQNQNLEWLVDTHNALGPHDLACSIHFNAYKHTVNPMGTEVLYLTQYDLADRVSDAISLAGNFKNRGAKERTDLYFLNQTDEPAILIEVCFVDSAADAENYKQYFDEICAAIADALL